MHCCMDGCKIEREREKEDMSTVELVPNKLVRQWGRFAFARHCVRLGVEFEDCYYMVFGRYPTR